MKPTENKLTDVFDNILEKSNGIVKDYFFYCSTSINERIEEYKGIKVFYSELIEIDNVYYTRKLN